MSYISTKIKRILDDELLRVKYDLLQLCELEDINIKKEIKLYFKNIWGRKMIDFKTQTKRSTKWHEGIININLFVKDKEGNGFEFGIVTSKYWGDFDEREEPLIELEIKGNQYQLPLNKFIKKVVPVLKRAR